MATDEQTLRIAEIHGRKETNDQLVELNKTLVKLVDELRQVRGGLASVSDAILRSAATSADRK